jgi:hypothetical protein
MPIAAPLPIRLDPNGRKHSFNDTVIGPGRHYLNEVPGGDMCAIRLVASVPWQRVTSRLPLPKQVSVTCCICSDVRPTIFQGQIAHQLRLPLTNVFAKLVGTPFGTYHGFWSEHKLWLSLGPGDSQLDVWFPVQQGAHGWEWHYAFPMWNVLGMKEVLDHRMLCMTAEHVCVFERK